MCCKAAKLTSSAVVYVACYVWVCGQVHFSNTIVRMCTANNTLGYCVSGSVRLSTAGSQALGDKSVSSSFDLRASSGLWPAMASMSASADMSARSNRPSNTTIAASGLSASVGDLRDQLLINRTVTPKSDSETSRSSVSTSGGALADSLAGGSHAWGCLVAVKNAVVVACA